MTTIIFEPLSAQDSVGALEASAPVARALFLDTSGNRLMAALPAMVGDITGAATGMALPTVDLLYAAAPALAADFMAGQSALIEAFAPAPTGMFTNLGDGLLFAQSPMPYGSFRQADQEAGFIELVYDAEPYLETWVGFWAVYIDEVLGAGTSTLTSFIVHLRERMGVSGQHGDLLHTIIELDESVLLGELISFLHQVIITEEVLLTVPISQIKQVIVELLDRLIIENVATSKLAAIETLAVALSLTDSALAAWLAAYTESLELDTSTLQTKVAAIVTVLEQLTASSEVDAAFTAVVTFDEVLLTDVEPSSTMTANVVLYEAIDCYARIRINNETYGCWIINTESKGVGRYTNFPFNSFAKAPWGAYIGATDTGLYELGGDKDDGEPILASIRSALTDFGDRRAKRVPAMYIGYAADGNIGLKVVHTSEQGKKVEDHYLMEPRSADAVRETRFKVGRGIASVYLGFELVNTDGADFTLDVVEWLPIRLDRRVR